MPPAGVTADADGDPGPAVTSLFPGYSGWPWWEDRVVPVRSPAPSVPAGNAQIDRRVPQREADCPSGSRLVSRERSSCARGPATSGAGKRRNMAQALPLARATALLSSLRWLVGHDLPVDAMLPRHFLSGLLGCPPTVIDTWEGLRLRAFPVRGPDNAPGSPRGGAGQFRRGGAAGRDGREMAVRPRADPLRRAVRPGDAPPERPVAQLERGCPAGRWRRAVGALLRIVALVVAIDGQPGIRHARGRHHRQRTRDLKGAPVAAVDLARWQQLHPFARAPRRVPRAHRAAPLWRRSAPVPPHWS